MARSHLTLAALATAAVEGLDVREVGRFDAGDADDYDSAVITGSDGRHLIVRIPRNERAETEQAADLQAISAMSVGVRSRLPFDVTRLVGQTPVGATRAVVTEFLYGSRPRLDTVRATDALPASIGRAIAAVHTLPTSFIVDAGLPVRTAEDVLRGVIQTVDRATSTNLVPVALTQRWKQATEDAALWQFNPTVVNGALTAMSLLQTEGEVCGVVGWHALSVGDPAKDLAFLVNARDQGVAESALDAYQAERGGTDRQLAQRARLYAELETAQWLLHGRDTRDSGVVDDAVAMMHTLLDRVQHDMGGAITHDTLPVMAVDEVEAMLDERERRERDGV